MKNPLRVTIVGAGIGGLSAAIALRDIGAEVVVIERAPEILVLGAGICLWPNGAQALETLGLVEALEDVSPLLHRLRYCDGSGQLRREMSFDYLTEHTGCRSFPLARSDLHVALLSRLAPNTIRLGAACVDVQQDESSVRAVLEDGTIVESDLLIGADGVRSAVRKHVTGGADNLRYHYSTWVGLVPDKLDLTPADTFSFYVQDSRRVGLLNVGNGRVYFFCDAAVPDTDDHENGAQARLQELFAGWCPTVQTLLHAVDNTQTRRLPVCDLDPLDTFFQGRVVLLGDAAHATTPTLGQGGAMAMEDAIVLARCLDTASDLRAALTQYEALRLPRTRGIVLASRARTAATLALDKAAMNSWEQRLATGESQDFMEEQLEIFRTGPLAAVASSATDDVDGSSTGARQPEQRSGL